MATYQEIVRSKLDSKLFNSPKVIAKNVTLISKSAPIYNSRGELDSNTETSSSVTIVPYSLMDTQTNYQPFGELLDGQTDAAVPWDVVIKKKDVIQMEGDNWIVVNVQPNYLPDNVVTIIRLQKEEN